MALKRNNLTLSFEFYPGRSPDKIEQLNKAVHALESLNPKFFSMTYGATGSDIETEPAVDIHRETHVPVAAHLTFARTPRDIVRKTAQAFFDAGIEHIVALRGDDTGESPKDSEDRYSHVKDLVTDLKAIGFDEISVAAYPEVHPLAESPPADLEVLRAKLSAGAARAITQFFFDNEDFLRFRDKASKEGIDAPIVPGILPIFNIDKVHSFATKCGARIPDSVFKRFNKINSDDKQGRNALAIELAAEQCMDLIGEGIDTFHFYTLNRADLCLGICQALGISPLRSNSPESRQSEESHPG